jgi:hypothetical protein
VGRAPPRLQFEGMSDEQRRPSAEPRPSPAERLLQERAGELPGVGKPFTERARIAQRSVEGYLVGANNPPRWMERVAEIDRRVKRERRLLGEEWRALRAEFGADDAGRIAFAREWRAFAVSRGRSREHRELNQLIRAHNEWYPVERDLPVNPRTGEWITARGGLSCARLSGPSGSCASFPPTPARAERRPSATGIISTQPAGEVLWLHRSLPSF